LRCEKDRFKAGEEIVLEFEIRNARDETADFTPV
jgi:hypothetical protein